MINEIQNEESKINYKDNNKYMSVGIDGCKGKWIAVCLTEEYFDVFPSFRGIGRKS